MSREEILRREGYGPTSPVVGERGAYTRRRITDESLRLFERHGFHGTSVDSIAKAVGISRPALYQYFESKLQIFLELLDECGSALDRVVRRIGPLGPTRVGFDDLHWWLGEWAYIYDKYATVHVQWANIDTPENPLRPVVERLVHSFHERIADRLASSGLQGLDPLDAAIALTGTVHRYHYFLHMGFAPPLSRDDLLDGLAVCMQLMLFPETPADALAAIAPGGRPRPTDDTAFPMFRVRELPAAEPGDGRQDREIGQRGRATRRRIVETGARLFTERGYHETSVDDLLAHLGLSRGAFYKYFPEKINLLLELADACAAAVNPLTGRLALIEPGQEARPQLRDWLLDFLPVYESYLGVIRAWLQGAWREPRLTATAASISAGLLRGSTPVLQGVDRRYPLDTDIAATVLGAMLARLPEVLRRPGQDDLGRRAELMAALIDRAMLSPGGCPAPG
jgi:AcrR family transcriptional regulator